MIEPLFAFHNSSDDLWRAVSFSEGLAAIPVLTDSGRYRWGYIDTSGQFVIDPQYPRAMPFSEGTAVVDLELFGPSVCIDRTGSVVLDGSSMGLYVADSNWGEWNEGFSEGLVSAQRGDAWGYVDKAGAVVIGFQFDRAGPFHEGLAPVAVGGNWGFIDQTGTMVIPAQYADAEPFSDGLAKIRYRGGAKAFIDKTGQVLLNDNYLSYSLWGSFSEGLAAVKRFYLSFINRSFDTVIETEWTYLEAGFSHGLALVSGDDDRFAYIDTEGRCVWRGGDGGTRAEVKPSAGATDEALIGTWIEVDDVWHEYEFRPYGIFVKRYTANGAEEEDNYFVNDGKLKFARDQVVYEYYLPKEFRLTIWHGDSVLLDLVRKR